MTETKINRPFPIWVLNLERSRDRREYMERQLKELNWQFEIVPAIDGKRMGSEELKYYSAQQAVETIERELTPGEIGCTLSHAKMWERIVAENIEEVLILEDDVVIKSELMDVLEWCHTFPEDWELINFRTDVNKIPFGLPVYAEYSVCHFQSYANRTCAYFINIKGAKKLCDHVYPIRLAADGLTGRTYISNLISYGVYPDLVELANFPSVLSDKVLGNSIDEIGGSAKVSMKQPTPAIGTPPLVSAIVSAYNAERFIRGCLEDLEAQTIADRLEIVVVDSGSSQNEGTIVREFQQRYDNIVYIRTARRESIYAAWNRGIQAARGMYITNANTDDRHKRDAFERMVAILETRPDIALVYANASMTRTENETFETHTPVGELNWPDFDPLELLYRCYMGPQPMWRKSMHATYGYFDESFEVAGDWEFWLRMAENETFLHLREFLGLYLSSPAGAENRTPELLGQENLRVYQRYVHRANQRTNAEAASGTTLAKPVLADQPMNAGAASGTAIANSINIKAYKLYDHAVVVQPASVERDGAAANGAPSADRAQRAASGAGWVLLCPHAFEATWNGGSNAEDIAIRLDAREEDDAPAFVQSNLGSGLLTFYPGYQVQTEGSNNLWVRGPINHPKDGLSPLEQIVDTSPLPATINVTWKCTRPNHTIRFAAGEPFGTILPYPNSAQENLTLDVVPLDADADLDAYEQALRHLTDSAAVQSVFQRMGAIAAETTPPDQVQSSDSTATASQWAAQLTNPPPVSCICLTYGRPDLLEEAIYSFLQQDYPDLKELIVLNDYDQQLLEFEHPEVRVMNVPKRFRTVGEKRNMAVALASHDLLFGWDDDDICLPHRLSFSVAHFNQKRGFFKASSAWFWNDGQLSGPARNNLHGISCWSRKLFDAVRGYGAAGSGEDMVFEHLLEHQFPGSTSAYDIWPEEIYYLYRWSGTGSYHMSGFGDYRPGTNIGHQEVEAFVQQRADQGVIPQGRILLQPHWNTDYRQLVSTYIATMAEPRALVQHA